MDETWAGLYVWNKESKESKRLITKKRKKISRTKHGECSRALAYIWNQFKWILNILYKVQFYLCETNLKWIRTNRNNRKITLTKKG